MIFVCLVSVLELTERFNSLGFKFVRILGGIHLLGITVLLYLTVEKGASLLIRDVAITPEVPLLVLTLSGIGAVLLRTFHILGKEYLRIFRPLLS